MREVAPFGTLICDDYGSVCDCCGRIVRRTRHSMWHGPHAICFACFDVWYDSGETTQEAIKQQVLEREKDRRWPFDRPSDADRVPA